MLIDNLVTSTTYYFLFMFSFAQHKLNALHIVFWIWSYFKFQQTDHIFFKTVIKKSQFN